MALGGGTFLTQNKVMPGSYINFISAARASATLSDRGYATMPLELSWGVDDAIFAVTSDEFQKYSQRIFGYAYTHEKLKGLRDLFANIKTGYFYKLNTGGAKAVNNYATALYKGVRGNDLSIIIEANEEYSNEAPLYDVLTYLETSLVDTQTVGSAAELTANDYIKFNESATLVLTAGTPLKGGTDGAVNDANYQAYLDMIEAYSFNTMGCLSTDDTIKSLFYNFTKRIRDDVGVKFQTVLFRYSKADYEGVISVENGLIGDDADSSAVWYVTGAEAGCAVNRSLTNSTYVGEYDIYTGYTQTELENGIKGGKLMFHKVGDDVKILTDINSFISITDEKSSDFGANQTIRVLDQIGNDIAALFNSKYLGKVQNDDAGRTSLWNDICKHHEEMQKIRAIEDFDTEDVIVERGDSKKAVVVTDYVTPVNAMEQLYMTVIVE